jgi:hypothetical protein
MVAPVKPRKVQANGKDSWWLVPAIADLAEPSVTEINAATGINVSCTLLASYEGMTASTAKVTLERFLCETEQFEANDVTSYTMSDIVGGFDPQATAASDDKKAFEFLRDGFVGYAVRRQGVTSDSATPDAVVGQFFDVVPVDIARAIPGKSNTDASGIYTFTAPVAVTGKPELNVAAVA